MKSSSPISSTTPTSCPGSSFAPETGARLLVAPVNDRGEVILEAYAKLLCPRTKMVALTQVSNALGTITPAQQMVAMAHAVGARTLVDGAQAVAHFPVNVTALDTDFYVFSGHKIYAPTGIGALYGKPEVLDAMPPWQGGGNMIKDVTFERTTYHPAPARFEAGTGNIADAVGLGAALDWLDNLGHERAAAYEHELLDYATAELSKVPGLTIIGTSPAKAGVISFVLAGQRDRRTWVGARPRRNCRALRTPLRPAHLASLWPGSHGARIPRTLQCPRRHRRPGGGPEGAQPIGPYGAAPWPGSARNPKDYSCPTCATRTK
jgi:cysteine desulfurase/selenocysteine lyase